ncbi:MAG: hypothetical protein Q9N26_04340 [Aquificota bacterium]|nr:hypothetical protein [Aquificota bacterium]
MEEVVARSVRIEVVGEIRRCGEGIDSKFYCLPVKIYFDNGEVRNYLLKAHNEPKGIENFLANKKGIKDRLEKSFVLLKNGEIRVDYSSRTD